MNQSLETALNTLIKWLVLLGFLSLPYTHFKWMPNLGTTRPVSSVFFAIAFGLVILKELSLNKYSPRTWLRWLRSSDNWSMLRWWVWLIGLGVLSTAITPFYGLPIQALIRLLGYFSIFTTLYMAAYSLPRYGIKTIARWIAWGYLPVLAYAIIEVLGILGFPWAIKFILWFREHFLFPFPWNHRLSLLTTEPSFVGFQALLLILVLPFVTEKWLRWSGWILVVLSLIFATSGTFLVLVSIYVILWLLFSLRRRDLIRLTVASFGLLLIVLVVNNLVPDFQLFLDKLIDKVFLINRFQRMTISFMIRYHYILNLIYALIETYGLGLGIGQYGYFWKEIYLRHIDYTRFDPTGEVARTLSTPGEYMKPWSVLLGVGVDLGILGLILLTGFFWQIHRLLSGPRYHALFFAILVGLAGAYPIVTPHLWLALALLAGIGLEQKRVASTT